MASEFPTSAAALTADWLTAVLRDEGALDGGRVASFTTSPVADPGQTAEVVRIALEYDGEAGGAPRTLVAKFPAVFDAARALAHQYDSYVREVRFYQHIARKRDLPVPRPYAAEVDQETQDFVLLMEDLAGGENGTLYDDDVGHVELALTHLARIHSEFWNDPVLDEHDWIRRSDDPEWIGFLKPIWAALVVQSREAVGSYFSDYTWRVGERWLEQWDQSLGILPGEPSTLLHVDAHPKQMFFPTEQLDRFAIFDWQSPSKGSAGSDVARLLVTGLSADTRREHEQALVAHYHRELCAGGVDGLSLERLWFLVKLSHLANLFINVVATLQTDVEIFDAQAKAAGQDWRDCLLGRVSAAADDWKLLDVLEQRAAEHAAAAG